jgi:peptide/nickel transport system substrate-binding protein
VEHLVNSGLASVDARGNLHPRLAETLPSLDNGLWKVSPDGRMETTWRIRDGARWHDGAPFTSEDVHFTIVDVGMDREVPVFKHIAYEAIDRVETPDPHTAVIYWKRISIDADKVITNLGTTHPTPLPKHLLAKPLAEDKASFVQLPYWTTEFVGSGPYRIREWAVGSYLLLQANPDYVLGRPKIDEIEIRFFPDVNTLLANVLAGGIDVTMGRGMSLEQALQARDQWREGRVGISPQSFVALFPQFINPNPVLIGDATFRRALVQAVDRQQLVDTLMYGQSSVAHIFINPNEPEYPDIEPSIVRIEYDPRAAAQAVEQLGQTRGADGLFRQPSGQPLGIQVQTTSGDVHRKALLAMADEWKQVGVSTEIEVLAPQRIDDREYRSTRPGFELSRTPNALSAFLARNHGSQTGLPEDNFRRYTNKSRYMNAEFDGLIDQFFATIPRAERMQVLGQIVRHMTERLNVIGIFYDIEAMAISSRMVNVDHKQAELAASTWNAHEWDTRE